MSGKVGRGKRGPAPVFAALGDETRLELLARLRGGPRRSITELTEGTRLTRQAITKHLRVLEGAGIVQGVRTGRERQFEFDGRGIVEARAYLERVSAEWDAALGRLKALVEKEE